MLLSEPWLEDELLDELLELGNDGVEDDDEDELGSEGVDDDEDDELGIEGMDEDEEEGDELGDGMDGAEDDEDELDEELGIDGAPLLELCCCVDSQPARTKANAEAPNKERTGKILWRRGVFIVASLSFGGGAHAEVSPGPPQYADPGGYPLTSWGAGQHLSHGSACRRGYYWSL